MESESVCKYGVPWTDHCKGCSAEAEAGPAALDVERLANIWERMHELFDFFPWYEAEPDVAARAIATEYNRLAGDE